MPVAYEASVKMLLDSEQIVSKDRIESNYGEKKKLYNSFKF